MVAPYDFLHRVSSQVDVHRQVTAGTFTPHDTVSPPVAALGAPRVPVRRGVALPYRSAYVPIRRRDCRGRCRGSLGFYAWWALLRVGGDRLGRPL